MVFAGPDCAQRVVMLDVPAVGLQGAIVLHSTALGPAAGGCRFWRYPDRGALVHDALRLAQGMSYKNALADLPLGGGKAVLQLPEGKFDRAALFAAFGREVARLDGTYIAAEDVGTTVADMEQVRSQTHHVAGLRPRPGHPGGDPSPWTARGVFLSMQVAVERRLGRPLSDVTVAVQGLGNVGFALCGLLHAGGARLVVADPREEAVGRAKERFDALAVSPDDILEAHADVFAPCALGGVLNERSIPRLRAKIVCGGANNQLGRSEDGIRLADRGILYAPDYVANAGGIINVSAEYLAWSVEEAANRVDAIGARMAEIFDRADVLGVPPNEAADLAARTVIAARRTHFATAA